ncbi:uncharacterized protein MEPE_02469 [Melanopsichium pennsylvanicum]|uniref:Uncharacterized protein n=1 Tax=Melanopsichium pennsylvanicum TaxID=63383 RepID=A0AAJ5C4J9_9BASI|nr:uncharacterized protein MEPE_02469 [Melanopsichium pennsylvanicum]
MGNKTTDQSFKKIHQVVGANGNDLVDSLNEKIMKEAPGHDGNDEAERTGNHRTHNEQIERDLECKGYSNRQTEEEAQLDAELRKKLDKRQNEAQ